MAAQMLGDDQAMIRARKYLDEATSSELDFNRTWPGNDPRRDEGGYIDE